MDAKILLCKMISVTGIAMGQKAAKNSHLCTLKFIYLERTDDWKQNYIVCDLGDWEAMIRIKLF